MPLKNIKNEDDIFLGKEEEFDLYSLKSFFLRRKKCLILRCEHSIVLREKNNPTEHSPIIKNQFKDNQRNIVWFPAVINMGSKGMIFPEGNDKDYVWKYAKIIDIPKEEQALYDNYNQRLDVDNAQEFKKDDFIGACKAMGITERIK